MIYKLTFLKSAKKEWDDLPRVTKKQLKTKLLQICEHPHIQKNKLSGLKDCYKIKLRALGYRLIYRVFDNRVIIQVIAIGKRDKSEVYKLVSHRME